MGKTLAYVRASTDRQDAKNQRHEILEHAHREKRTVDDFIEVTISSRQDSRQRRIEELQERLEPGDILLVTELSRLGRSTGEVIILINQLVTFGVTVIVIKQNLVLSDESQDMTAKVMVTLLALFAEIERDFISLRTKESLAAKKAAGVTLGKPKGTIQRSMYDKDRARIEELLQHGVPQTRIVETHLGYGTTKSLSYYVRTRGLKTEPEQKTIQVELYLRVENNNKFVRGKTRARRTIEDFVLSQYAVEKPDKNGWQYILTIPYRTQDDLDDTIYDILREAQSTADERHCFIEADVIALDGSGRSW
jgi:DNA invertase Pin-like site-specific DNA recombinase